jgi:UDP-N-acetylglucosamine 2-epimerase (non-hydrolysing)
MKAQGITAPGVRLTEPLGYLDFLSLVEQAAGVLTDSGGIQEETTFLGIPCFTLRDNTERPVTIELGTNQLLGLDPGRILELPQILAQRNGAVVRVPPGWDGHAAKRLVEVLLGRERFATLT